MVDVAPGISMDESEVEYSFVTSSGPGGQNVNKVATAVQLRFDAANSPSLPERVRMRLRTVAGKRMTADGIVMIKAQRYRSQEMNKEDALARLVELVRRASEQPRTRRPTAPSRGAKERRLEEKSRRSETKRLRRSSGGIE
ncbi:MAG: alternative ribosome rescue aminoacyl-tRNA hydrolase ArfB [Dehalococcoidia bacterium]